MSIRALAVALMGLLLLPSVASAAFVVPEGAARPLQEGPAGAALEAADMASDTLDSVSKRSEPLGTGIQDLIWPVKDTINTPFGGGHDGIDIEGETGDPVVAAGSGRITFAGDDGDGYGTKIVIDHGSGVSTLYSHLDSMKVEKGTVDQGEVIGTVGCSGSCTGDHLHFEILRGDRPIDPVPYLR
ncbi:MAG: M23 family metallopeptidase [Actinomycetota bacterium]|nr:M23 family metallopeptidase [Actinomycetota bacterium]